MFGPDSLVAFLVFGGGVAVEVGWQGNGAVLLGELGEWDIGFDLRDAVA